MGAKRIVSAVLLTVFLSVNAITIVPENGQHFRKAGEPVKFFIQLDENRANVRFPVLVYGRADIRKVHYLTSDASGKAELTVTAGKPGFIYARVEDNKNKAAAGVAIEPEKITPSRPVPEDFDAYWENIKKQIDAMPMDPEITELPGKHRDFRVYKVRINLGDKAAKDAYGVVAIPKKAAAKGKLPARLMVKAAGSDKIYINYRYESITMTLNPFSVDNQGKDGDYIKRGHLKNYHRENSRCLDRDTVFFNGMFQRVYRALQYLKSLPEWDGRTLIISGISQGGGQALAGAGLDNDVTLCVAHVPALCSHAGRADGFESGWPFFFQLKLYKENTEKVLKATAYVDAVNFASRISKNTEVYISTGFIDRACPSATVYAAYNVIPSANKRIVNNVLAMHRVPKETRDEAEKIIKQHIEKMRSK
ncbi:MAG: acetylxylan esterase [Lentisphaeria bacterium]|nr:acetylxylan esterase [Lentisphaeria bacterium]